MPRLLTIPVLAVAAFGFAVTAAARDASSLTVTSSAFTDGGAIPRDYTCEGKSLPPPIAWAEVPAAAKSLAVIVEDPDAPGGTFEHLVAYNLPPTQQSLPTTALASLGQPGSAMMSARNDSGGTGFAPICPPSGRHRYRFIVVALDTTLSLPPSAPAGAVRDAMNGHIVARGVLVGTYQSQRK